MIPSIPPALYERLLAEVASLENIFAPANESSFAQDFCAAFGSWFRPPDRSTRQKIFDAIQNWKKVAASVSDERIWEYSSIAPEGVPFDAYFNAPGAGPLRELTKISCGWMRDRLGLDERATRERLRQMYFVFDARIQAAHVDNFEEVVRDWHKAAKAGPVIGPIWRAYDRLQKRVQQEVEKKYGDFKRWRFNFTFHDLSCSVDPEAGPARGNCTSNTGRPASRSTTTSVPEGGLHNYILTPDYEFNENIYTSKKSYKAPGEFIIPEPPAKLMDCGLSGAWWRGTDLAAWFFLQVGRAIQKFRALEDHGSTSTNNNFTATSRISCELNCGDIGAYLNELEREAFAAGTTSKLFDRVFVSNILDYTGCLDFFSYGIPLLKPSNGCTNSTVLRNCGHWFPWTGDMHCAEAYKKYLYWGSALGSYEQIREVFGASVEGAPTMMEPHHVWKKSDAFGTGRLLPKTLSRKTTVKTYLATLLVRLVLPPQMVEEDRGWEMGAPCVPPTGLAGFLRVAQSLVRYQNCPPHWVFEIVEAVLKRGELKDVWCRDRSVPVPESEKKISNVPLDWAQVELATLLRVFANEVPFRLDGFQRLADTVLGDGCAAQESSRVRVYRGKLRKPLVPCTQLTHGKHPVMGVAIVFSVSHLVEALKSKAGYDMNTPAEMLNDYRPRLVGPVPNDAKAELKFWGVPKNAGDLRYPGTVLHRFTTCSWDFESREFEILLSSALFEKFSADGYSCVVFEYGTYIVLSREAVPVKSLQIVQADASKLFRV
ncbi:unnamed protein product [Amoebophrya sp. A120]|nr:unnamed protein product [Amoebophrya sp. A120]|eukprot:GSA120T00013010001.1